MPVQQDTIRTTVTIPKQLLEVANRMIEEGLAKNRNELFSRALEKELLQMRRHAIDEAFGMMAQDADYQTEALGIMSEFAKADSEADGHIGQASSKEGSPR